MALLYLIDDEFAVDDQGWEWMLDESGAWRPKVEWKRPQLELIVTESDDAVDAEPAG
jgi:hypothetical protein